MLLDYVRKTCSPFIYASGFNAFDWKCIQKDFLRGESPFIQQGAPPKNTCPGDQIKLRVLICNPKWHYIALCFINLQLMECRGLCPIIYAKKIYNYCVALYTLYAYTSYDCPRDGIKV